MDGLTDFFFSTQVLYRFTKGNKNMMYCYCLLNNKALLWEILTFRQMNVAFITRMYNWCSKGGLKAQRTF